MSVSSSWLTPFWVFCLAPLVVGEKFCEGDRLVVVHLYRCVQDAVVRLEVRPVVGVRVAVYVSVQHIRSHAVVERHHRIVAKRNRVFSVGRFEHRMNALEVARKFNLASPG